MRAEIEEAFKHWLDLITDPSLREKAIAAWEPAAQKGGWQTFDEIVKMPFTLATDCNGIGFIEHTLAVTKGAYELAQAQKTSYREMPYEIDMDLLIAGGLLHDVGKLLEIQKSGDSYIRSENGKRMRHPISGAVVAMLAGLSDDVANMIACHSTEGDNRMKRIETILIHQADFATFNPLVMKKAGKLI